MIESTRVNKRRHQQTLYGSALRTARTYSKLLGKLCVGGFICLRTPRCQKRVTANALTMALFEFIENSSHSPSLDYRDPHIFTRPSIREEYFQVHSLRGTRATRTATLAASKQALADRAAYPD